MVGFSNQGCPAVDIDPAATRFGMSSVPDGRGLKKRNVVFASVFLALLLVWVVIAGILPRARSLGAAKDNLLLEAKPSELIQRLPSSYERRNKGLDGAGSGLARKEKQQSLEDKLKEELRIKRLRRQELAREASVFFAGGRSDQVSFQERGGSLSSSSLNRGVLDRGSGIPHFAAEGGYNPRESDSRQDEKEAFLSSERQAASRLEPGLTGVRSPYEVMAGTLIPAVLVTGLNSDLPGKILGQVSQNVFDTKSGRYLLLPQGTKLLGEYDSRIAYGQERVLVVWTRLILPNGKSVMLEGMPGVDLFGYAGVSDQVNNHYGKLLTGVLLSSFLSATVQMAQGERSYKPSWGELAAEGVAENVNQVGQQITRKNLNIQPTIEVRPGMRLNVFVTKDIALEPYKP